MDEIHLWSVVPEALSPRTVDRLAAWLSPPEQERWERRGRSRDYLAGRTLARHVLAGHLDIGPEAVELVEDALGRPELAREQERSQLSFNISGTQGMALCAVARGAQVGVDVEALTRRLDPSPPIARSFAPCEREDIARQPGDLRGRRILQYWTLKEAYVKALGTGLTLALDRFWFELDGDEPRLVLPPGPRPHGDSWRFFQRSLGERHLAAVAVKTETAGVQRLVVRAWRP
jgi:4'-phosphopantetheinyl transferase